MKLEMDRTGAGFKILADDGTDITKQVPVRAVTVECSVDNPTMAIMEVALVETSVVTDQVEYYAGQYGQIKGLILEDGTLHYFPGKRADDDPVDWKAECRALVDVLDDWKQKTHEEKRAAWKRAIRLLRGQPS